jgi:hypothetical protein
MSNEKVTRSAFARRGRESADVVKRRKAQARRLFAALDVARNDSPVGPLKREELYDRRILRET